MHQSTFFKMFPPPGFMTMRYAGLDMSGDYISFVRYSSKHGGLKIEKFGNIHVGREIAEGGDIKNEQAFAQLISDFQKKHKLSYVKVSVPEEKAYLFQTEVPSMDMHSVKQNIEFKLEENVPLQAMDAVFYFDILPFCGPNGQTMASVSVVPKSYIEKILALLKGVGMFPVAFEVIPKAIARTVSDRGVAMAEIIVNIMERRVGIYIVIGEVVCFSSTLNRGEQDTADADMLLAKEINRIDTYWQSRCQSHSGVDKIVVVGKDASRYEKSLIGCVEGRDVPVVAANIWRNAIDFDEYVPPIPNNDSFMYAVAAGLAIPVN